MNQSLVSYSEIDEALRQTRSELAPYLSRLDFTSLAKYNRGYQRYASGPVAGFVDAELHIHRAVVEFCVGSLSTTSTIMEIGFFIPIIPIALAKLGFHVEAVEKLDLYGSALDELILFTKEKYGINVRNLDILNDNIDSLASQYNGIILSSIIEHLNGSPKALLERAQLLGKPNALYWISAPNAASLQKRIAMLLKGVPPYPPIADYFHSDYPFTGHNREYTLHDLLYVTKQSGFRVIRILGFNRPTTTPRSLREAALAILLIISSVGPDSWKQSLAVIAQVNKERRREAY